MPEREVRSPRRPDDGIHVYVVGRRETAPEGRLMESTLHVSPCEVVAPVADVPGVFASRCSCGAVRSTRARCCAEVEVRSFRSDSAACREPALLRWPSPQASGTSSTRELSSRRGSRDRSEPVPARGRDPDVLGLMKPTRAPSCGDAPRSGCLHSSSKSCAWQPMCSFVSECSFHMCPLARALLRARCRRRRRRCHAVSSSCFASVSDTSAHFLSYPAHGVKGSTSVSPRSARRP